MDSKDLEVAGTFKVLGYELASEQAETLYKSLGKALGHVNTPIAAKLPSDFVPTWGGPIHPAKPEMQSVPDAVKDEIVYIRDSIDSPFEPVAPATGDTDIKDKWESVEEGVRGDGATETVSIPGPDFDTVMAAGKEMDISNAHIPLAPVVDALKAEEANILKHEEWKSGWLKGMAEEMNKLTRECAANASR